MKSRQFARPLMQQLGLNVVAFRMVDKCEAVKRLGDAGVVWTESLLSHGQGTLIQRLGLCVVAFFIINWLRVLLIDVIS